MVWIETQSVKACPASAGWPQSKLCGLWTPCKPEKRLYKSRVPNRNEMQSESCAYSLSLPRKRRLSAFFERQLVSQRQPLWLLLGCIVEGCEGAVMAVSVAIRHDLRSRSHRNVRETRQEGPCSVLGCVLNFLAFARPFVGVKCVFLGGVCERGSAPLVFISPSHKLK